MDGQFFLSKRSVFGRNQTGGLNRSDNGPLRLQVHFYIPLTCREGGAGGVEGLLRHGTKHRDVRVPAVAAS
ncbi:hypothetical protein C8N36_107112 [Pelagimonas varians]|uniref:Uncharacterized protein n=1 Tax=Pelagimonas varians TaxID=696760 RepID=A0A238KEZ1_9RHOB|nr:hypothetical protein C8N36_107112 [Pelagimonas varians]SMX40682.1 hypothetical protein PEV8663_02083 [Pelagimonas varians]